MSAGTSEQWYKLWDKFVAESDANEKLKLLSGLASVKDTVLLKRLLVLAEDETYIRSQDYFTCVKYIAANPIGEPIVWDYVRCVVGFKFCWGVSIFGFSEKIGRF